MAENSFHQALILEGIERCRNGLELRIRCVVTYLLHWIAETRKEFIDEQWVHIPSKGYHCLQVGLRQFLFKLLDKHNISTLDQYYLENYRIINNFRLVGTQEIPCSSWDCLKPNHMTKSIVQTLLENWQAWCHNHFLGEPVPVINHPLGEEPFPKVQSELLRNALQR